jgi:hypothetical protein
MATNELGAWSKVADVDGISAKLKAFNTARSELEKAVRAKHAGAVFSYKHGDAKFACPIVPVKTVKGNGVGKLTPQQLAAIAAILGQ